MAPRSIGLGLGFALALAVRTAAAQTPSPPPLPPPDDAPPGGTAPEPPPSSIPPPGPPGGPPAPGSRVAPRRPAPLPVRFEPAEPDVHLLALTGERPVERVMLSPYGWWFDRHYEPLYSPVCDRSCTARFEPGAYHFALSKEDGRAVPSREPVFIRGPSTLHASYVDRSGTRALGTVITLAGDAAGIIMLVSSVGEEVDCDAYGNCYRRVNGPLMAGGIGVLVAATIGGAILLLQHDEARLTVTPLTLPYSSSRHERAWDRASVQGVGVGVRF